MDLTSVEYSTQLQIIHFLKDITICKTEKKVQYIQILQSMFLGHSIVKL